MSCRSHLHSNRDMFWGMHRDITNAATGNIMRCWWSAMPNWVNMHSNHDLWRTLPHHGTQWRTANPGMHSRRFAMSCGSYLYSNRNLQRLMHCNSISTSDTDVETFTAPLVLIASLQGSQLNNPTSELGTLDFQPGAYTNVIMA
jgi:hypothetical protein